MHAAFKMSLSLSVMQNFTVGGCTISIHVLLQARVALRLNVTGKKARTVKLE